jgi:hypothetical protein
MPDLKQSLQGRDLGYLRIIAELWGIELNAPDARVAMERLQPSLLDFHSVNNLVGGLPPAAREALDDLYQNDGRLPWPLFTRRYGVVREMGAGRRDRLRPYQKGASPAEALWYRALVGRAFFDTPTGPEEFAFIPDDLLPLLPVPRDMASPPLGRPATPAERAHLLPVGDSILDHACTLLAALRLGLPLDTISISDPLSLNPLSPALLQILLKSATLLDETGLPQSEAARAFLEAGRGESLSQLFRAWRDSSLFNELRLEPSLQAEGEWQNDPLAARRAILGFLATVPGYPPLSMQTQPSGGQGQAPGGQSRPPGEKKRLPADRPSPYWSLDSFISAIREKQPDFQRPGGDYDSWFVRSRRSGEFLRGFEHWEDVEGALIRFVITGPLHWLGILDLAAPDPQRPVTAFRFSIWAAALLDGKAPEGLAQEKEGLVARSDGRLSLSRRTPRATRYQIARFCLWEGEKNDCYLYRLTPSSLSRARQQGLTVAHLLALLARNAEAIPPSLVNALKRWDQQGAEVRLEELLVLRLSSPDLLQKLRSSRAARFLGEPLGPTTVIVKAGAGQKVLDALVEMGILGEVIGQES